MRPDDRWSAGAFFDYEINEHAIAYAEIGLADDKTRAQIQQMQESAQAEIEREKQSALDSLRTEVADLAVQAAEKILRANLDADRQKKIVNDFLGDLPKN